MAKKFDLLPAEALKLMERHTANTEEAKDLLANALRDGTLSARARVWQVYDPNMLTSSNRAKAPDDAKRKKVSNLTLMRSLNFDARRRDWNWSSSFFFCEIQSQPFVAEIYKSVRFSRETFNQVVRREAQRKHSKGGRNPKIDAWEQVCFAVVRLVKNGTLDLAKPIPTKVFANAIAKELVRKPATENELTSEQIEGTFSSVCPLAHHTLEDFADRFRSAVWPDLVD